MITHDIELAIQTLNVDDLIAIPTETVYGLAANAYSENAVEKIFALKKRPHYNPLIIHIDSIDSLSKVAKNIPEKALVLARAFWPGPLTLLLEKLPHIPDLITAGHPTVAVRVPDHPMTLELLRWLEYPLAAPSANPFGSISPTTAEHVEGYFGDDLRVILDGGPCQEWVESTIIGFEGETPILYRHGSLSIEDIESLVGTLEYKNKDDVTPAAPGMLSRHYAPRTETYLSDDIMSLIERFPEKKIGVLTYERGIDHPRIVRNIILSPTGSLEEATRNLYASLHELDRFSLDVIIAERFPNAGLGRTINDRLERAVKR